MQGPKRGGKVLVTEDNPLHMKIFKLNLTAAHCQVSEAINGEEGLRLAREDRPDVILADLSLPKVDGVDMIRTLKADPATADIPIIVVSARMGEREALAPYVVDYVLKPFDPEALTELVLHTIERARG